MLGTCSGKTSMMRKSICRRGAGLQSLSLLVVIFAATSAAVALAGNVDHVGQSDRGSGAGGRGVARATTVPAEPTTTAVAGPVSPADWYKQGLALAHAGKAVEARRYLSTALCSERLTAAQESRAARVLGELADSLFFGPDVAPGDPIAWRYTVRGTETPAQIVRQQKLEVSPILIACINDLTAGATLRTGQRLKLVRGPVHVLVQKHSFALDLYVLESDGNKLILERIAVGLGKQDSTPTGQYVVGPKAINPTWQPPANSKFAERGAIQWGEPDYPFGQDAFWIGLDAMNGQGAAEHSGLGLHSTSDQSSIGKTKSMGCIRVGKGAIPRLYMLLATGVSTVQIDP